MGQFSCLCLWLGAFRRILYIGVPYSRKKNTYHSTDSWLLWHLCIFLFQSTCSFHGIPSSGPDKQIIWLDFQDLFFYYCHLLTNYANSLDPDQVRQNVGSDLDPTCLPLCRYKCNHVGMFQILKEIISRQQDIMNYFVISTKISMYWSISSYRVFLQYVQQPL